jgi:Zn-finger nucleic acid-binding protein
MSTHPYYGPGTIVIDNCDRCKVVWLDYGELARVVNAPGGDRGAALLKPVKPPAMADQSESAMPEGRKAINLLELLDDLFS